MGMIFTEEGWKKLSVSEKKELIRRMKAAALPEVLGFGIPYNAK